MLDIGSTCEMSLDETDCPIQKPMPFIPKYFSHKFHGPGVKYKVGICICNGWICCFNGPFPCGNPDIVVAHVGTFGNHEKLLADGG
jgi:hypothetical protein